MSENLGALGDAIYAKVAEIAEANEVVKQLDLEKRALEDKLLSLMDSVGTDIVRGNVATVSVSENVRAQIADFDKFAAFVLRKKALHLFERRVAANAYREMKDSLRGKEVPGISEYTNRRLNIRKA